MELASIEKLIEKYENAETSLKEEAALKTYFSEDIVAPHLEQYKAMFTYFQESKEQRFTKTIPLRKKTSNMWWLSIAASVAVIFSVYFMDSPSGLTASEQEEAEMALLETQKAFQLISQNLNKGGNVAIAGLSEFEKAQNKVFKLKK